MIHAKTYKDNFLKYLIFEMILVGFTTALMLAVWQFYSMINTDANINTDNYGDTLKNPMFFIAICVFPAIGSILFILLYRKRNYIVGWKSDKEKVQIVIRGLFRSSIETVEINKTDVQVVPFKDPKFIIVPQYQGYRIVDKLTGRKFDFVSNNFIWETQIADKVLIFHLLKMLEEEQVKDY